MALTTDAWNLLACPVSGEPLRQEAAGFHAGDGTLYPMRDGVADLLDPRLMDAEAKAEIEVFDHALPFEKVSYFRPSLFRDAAAFLAAAQPSLGAFVEIGGGEGYLAAAVADRVPGCAAYVCDLSLRGLVNADARLRRVRCDVRFPYLQSGAVDAAAFWVSLHHFSGESLERALDQAARVLAPGGVLLVFEPSEDFVVRRLFYRMALSRLVYYDDKEKGLRADELTRLLKERGLAPLLLTSHNPPYNTAFLRNFTMWPLFYLVTETLHQAERLFVRPVWTPDGRSGRTGTGLYLMALFRKG